MENYGLLVFKESLLLIDPNNCSVHGLAEAALVICHEIAHQWFGNLVTMVINNLFKSLFILFKIKKHLNIFKLNKGMVDGFVAKRRLCNLRRVCLR